MKLQRLLVHRLYLRNLPRHSPRLRHRHHLPLHRAAWPPVVVAGQWGEAGHRRRIF
jgi:hypothetical protein